MSWLRALFGYQVITQAGIPMPQRPTLEVPAGSLVDDPLNQRTVYVPPTATFVGTYAPTPNTAAQRGASGEGLFAFLAAQAAAIAKSGLVRLTSAVQTAVAAQSAANPAKDVPLLGIDGFDGVLVGGANAVSISLIAATAIALLTSRDLQLRNGLPLALTPGAAPSNPALGWRLYVDSADGHLKAKKSDGTIVVLAS
jgi:hypothetical protein